MNIYIIGYRGSGKTTLGRKISYGLNFEFADMDEIIVKEEKRPIPVIFASSGERYFRGKESEVLEHISKSMSPTVVSTGGGIILSSSNRDIIKRTGFCVYLKASKEILQSRIEGDNNRPPLTSLPLAEEITRILSIREPLYEETADITVDTGIQNTDGCSDFIIKSFKKWRNEK
jgi:shikimate kinase